jgi:SAM-dependent methyltransferase
MKKQSRLGEKGTRTTDARERQWEEVIGRYLTEMGKLPGEPARSHRFSILANELLGCQPGLIEDYLSGIEKHLRVRQKDRMLRGRADALFGSAIIEFESQIPKNLPQAESQLRRYVAIVWSRERPEERRPYLCIATDGVRFRTYSPAVGDPGAAEITDHDVQLTLLEESDWSKLEAREVFYWLDRHFVRQEILHPTTELIERDFGARSHAFQTVKAALLSLWQDVKKENPFAVIYDNWDQNLRTAYGSDVGGDELFVRHTYLATLAKLMSWMRITESKSLPEDGEVVDMLEGRLFKAQGIENFIEEDFFSWVSRAGAVSHGLAVTRWLFSMLQNYNLRELSEDVLKALYQQLVDPEMRHDLGEYYTPDWLAHRIVRRLLDENPRGKLLDPACGSGTFLYLAIREKAERLGRSARTLKHILDSVYGIDVHPLAVIIAKTNYILALGDLLAKRRGRIGIPVYLADALKLPHLDEHQSIVLVNGTPVPALPHRMTGDPGLYDRAIELASEYAAQHKGSPVGLEGFRSFLAQHRLSGASDIAFATGLFEIAEMFKRFIDSDRDTIWAFILKNIFKPIFLKWKFDFVVGNPPWIAFRYLQPEYQNFVKWQVRDLYALIRKRLELITHLEVASFFLVRAADLYLKTGGEIAFVMPRSTFTADQHDGLRRATFRLRESPGRRLVWNELWDCERVTPLFNVPASVLIAEKVEGAETTKPSASAIPGQVISGTLHRRNADHAESRAALSVEKLRFSLHTRAQRSFWAPGKATATHRPSPYKARFAQGATIVPRSFWFVQLRPSPLGFDTELPPLETAPRAKQQAKAPYKDVSFSANVESDFLYATLLSTDLLPFGHLGYRLVVLPIERKGNHYELVHADEARRRGFLYLAKWLGTATAQWDKLRGAKAKRMTLYQRLDRVHALTHQDPTAEYGVIYNKSGTFLTAAPVARERISWNIGGQKITAVGYVADHVTYQCGTGTAQEAFFLAAVLNAPRVNHAVKPMQARGLWGPRDLHKKVLELPIPEFDPKKASHRQLAELGEACTEKVKKWLDEGGPGKTKSIGKLRSIVRLMLKEELEEIDALTGKLLGVPE